MHQMFLIVVDTHSKWMEAKAVTTAVLGIMTYQLHSIFATHRLPEMVVTDNGSGLQVIHIRISLDTMGFAM